MTTQRLEELLAAKDEEIESLREKLEELENKQQHHEFDLQQARGGYFLPFEEPDDGVSVVPRLEWRCENLRGDWGVTIYRCFLVQKHFLNAVLTFWPIYYTKQVSSGSRRAPWEYSPLDLPRRDGVHAEHDSGHLRVPLYLRTPTGLMPLNSHAPTQVESKGRAHRRLRDPKEAMRECIRDYKGTPVALHTLIPVMSRHGHSQYVAEETLQWLVDNDIVEYRHPRGYVIADSAATPSDEEPSPA